MKVGKGVKFLTSALVGAFCFSQVALADNTSVVAKNSDVKWKLYGRVKVDFNYDTVQFKKYNDFIGAVTNSTSDWENDSTNFNPRDTRIGAIVTSKEGNWEVKGHTEIDFYGDTNGNNLIPRMRLGYIGLTYVKTRTNIRIGQDWIPIAQLNPSTIDFGILTAAGNLWWRVPQITIRQNFMNNWQILFSAMRHRRISTTEEVRMPWVLTRIQYKDGLIGKGSMLAIGGGYRHDTIDRWLIAGEWKFKFNLAGQKVLFKGEAWTGAGIDDEFLRYELGENNGTAVRAWGAWADLTWIPTSKISFTIGAGIDDPDDDDIMKGRTVASLSDRQFTQNIQCFANVWYKLTKHVKIGAEVVHVETERKDDLRKGNRFTLSAFYNF